jgi:uridylate kinase
MKALVGNKWLPGKNVPFDPVATSRAAESGLTVITAAGRDIKNLHRLLEGQSFEGTVIGPD